MKRTRILGLCLVAVFALSAVIASSASAAPGWYECAKAAKNATTKKYEGKFIDKYCATEASAKEAEEGKTNKYELKAGIGKGKGFKGKTTAKATLYTTTPLGITAEVSCTSASDSGKLALPNIEKEVVAVFKGCETGGNKCSSAGAKAGEIKTNNLAGVLVNIAAIGGGGIGVELGSEAGPASPQVIFSCKVVTATVYGGIIGRRTSAAAKGTSKESTTTYSVGKFLGEVEAEGYKWEPITNFPLIEGSPKPVYLASGLCGEEVELLLKKECAPPIPSGQEQVVNDKGEALLAQ